MGKKKTKKRTMKKISKKTKMPFSDVEKYIKMASMGQGKDFMRGVMGLGGMPSASMGMGPGTHAPVKESGAAVGKMADGRMIHLTGPMKGQMVQ